MDKKNFTGLAARTAVSMMLPGGSLIGPLAAIAVALASSQEDIKEAEGKSLESLEDSARKQQILMDFQAHQARVAQEISIAQRISSSTEVEIEEYYDTSGKANAGLKSEKESLSMGLSGEGRKVTKRIIKFRGWSAVPPILDGPAD